VAPVVEAIEITPANYRFPPQSLTLTPSQNLTLPPIGQKRRPSAPLADSGTLSMQYAKGHLGARWQATDSNGDALIYTVELRGAGESEWKLLRDKVKEKHASWDSTAFPDGEYRLRVTATDSPSNPPGQALSAQLESEPFLVDNTPPRISGLTTAFSGGKLQVRWKAADALNIIAKAEYSLNGGDWIVVEPTTKLSDALEHEYDLRIADPPAGEITVAIRVTDGYDNQALDKAVVRR
jgi:hypothetical protein